MHFIKTTIFCEVKMIYNIININYKQKKYIFLMNHKSFL